MAKTSNNRVVFGVFAIFFGGVAFIAKQVVRKNWFLKEVSVDDFSVFPGVNVTVREVTTTYYDSGNLKEQLPMWHKGEGSYLHLYRLTPGQSFEFDWEIMYNSSTGAKKERDSCLHPESALCAPCFDNEHHKVTVESILRPSEGSSSAYYAAFAKLSEFSTIRQLFALLQLPGIDVDKMNFEHAFISNLKAGKISAPIHGNSATSSMAVQFIGKKTWLFFPPHVYRDFDMMDAFAGTGSAFPTQAPKKSFEVYVYTAQPGDVLFFGENWAHVVYTHPGPNLLMNFRHFEVGNLLRQPIDWAHGVFNTYWFTERHTDPTKNGRATTPYNPLVAAVYSKMNRLCSFESGLTGWDKQMVSIIEDYAQAK